MTYSEFKQLVLSYLREQLGHSVKISIQPVIKNNHVTFDSLLILEPGCNATPSLYLNYYYDKLKNGADIESVLRLLLDTYQSNKLTENIDVRFFTEYENVSGRILYKLINTSQNKELLQEIPHIKFLDLAIVFYCLVSTNDVGSATILIRNQHLSLWDVTPDMLHQQAAYNTPRLMPPKLIDMNSLLQEFAPDFIDSNSFTPSPLYVLTNSEKLYGAAAILNAGILKNFSITKNSDFYILPSSIHEVLLFPANQQLNPAELNKMVQEVNQTQLSREDVLSDHVYYYSLQEQSIQIVSEPITDSACTRNHKDAHTS